MLKRRGTRNARAGPIPRVRNPSARQALVFGKLIGMDEAHDRQVFAVGCRYWPSVRISVPCRQILHRASTSSRVSPKPSMSPLFVASGRKKVLRAAQELERAFRKSRPCAPRDTARHCSVL